MHALCSYQGKLKPGLAHTLIESMTAGDATVLDPLGGVGTIAFEAALSGREAWSNDLSPLAFIVAQAKLDPPPMSDFDAALAEFEAELEVCQKTPSGSIAFVAVQPLGSAGGVSVSKLVPITPC